jgi:hypothetical protein
MINHTNDDLLCLLLVSFYLSLILMCVYIPILFFYGGVVVS